MSAGEERVADAGREDHDPAFLHMTLGAAADIGLADRIHMDRRQDTGRNAHILKHTLHGESVHDGCQHAHGIGLGAFHALRSASNTAENVAPADNQADFGAGSAGFCNGFGEFFAGRDIDAELTGAHQGLSRKLQKHTFVLKLACLGIPARHGHHPLAEGLAAS